MAVWSMWKSLALPAVACGQSPTVGGGGDVHAHFRGHLWSLTPSGQVRWRLNGSSIFHIDARDAVYALMKTDEKTRRVALMAISSETGDILWEFKLHGNGGGFLHEAPIADDGTVYVTKLGKEDNMGRFTSPHTVQAVDAHGNLKWIEPLGSGYNCSHCNPNPPVLGHDGTVFVTSRDGTGRGSLHALRPENGTRKWSIQGVAMDGEQVSRIAVGRDGTLYVTVTVYVYVTPRETRANATSLLIMDSAGNVHINKTLELCGDEHDYRNRPSRIPHVGFSGDVVYMDGVRFGGDVTSCGVCAFDREGELLWTRGQSFLTSVRYDEAMNSDVLMTRKFAESSDNVSTVATITGHASTVWEANISTDYGYAENAEAVTSSKDGTYYFSGEGLNEGKVLAMRDGKELWHTDLHCCPKTDLRNMGSMQGLAVTDNGVVYAQFRTTHDGNDWYVHLAALGSNGSQMWNFTADVPNLATVV